MVKIRQARFRLQVIIRNDNISAQPKGASHGEEEKAARATGGAGGRDEREEDRIHARPTHEIDKAKRIRAEVLK